jgi:hypothetical protein
MVKLSAGGRAARLVATVAAGGLLLAGTIWGDDDHFPFGPFRMYSTTADPDAPARDTRLEATDVEGAIIRLGERNTGIRRAEVEGQLERLRQDPGLLAAAGAAYAVRNPDAAPLREIRVVIRWHDVRNFQPTGTWTEEVAVTWRP